MPTLPAGNSPRVSGSSGFTLIEVLVVLVILALAMAVVVPAISKGLGGSLDEVARDLQMSLRKARSDAILGQRTSAVLVDVNGRRFWLEREGTDRSIPENITVSIRAANTELIGGTAGIRFFPDGSSTGGSIDLSIGDSSSKVQVDWLSGRVSVRPQGG